MSRGAWDYDRHRPRGLYRDRENGWLFGVCAGVADFMNFNIGATRIVVVVSLLVIGWPIILGYFAAVFLLRSKPLIYSGMDAENEFWTRRSGHYDHWSRR